MFKLMSKPSIAILFLGILFSSSLASGDSMDYDFPSQSQSNVIVELVCNQTSSYSFCKDALYSDPMSVNANQYTVAYTTVSMTYSNATGTRSLISDLLEDLNLSPSEAEALKRCGDEYDNAIGWIESAYVDLNDETFSDLSRLASMASLAADNCLAAFGDDGSPPELLVASIQEFKVLLQASQAVGNMYCDEL